jgi:hypothetical protein
VPEGEVKRVEVLVAERSSVTHEESELTLTELVLHVGRRVTVHCRGQHDRCLVDRLIVEP